MKTKFILSTLIITTLTSNIALAGGIGTTNTLKYEKASSYSSDYIPVIPNNTLLDYTIPTNAEEYSPLNFNDKFIVVDHIGHTDTAYNGARHIVTYNDSGMVWYGYDEKGYTDLILTETDNYSYTINLKQMPLRADWHTVNGSGIIFNASTSAQKGTEVNPYTSTDTFTGYALVVTTKDIEVRYYPLTTLSTLADGLATYEVLYSTSKTCNAQDLTITYTGAEVLIYLDNTLLTTLQLDYIGSYVGAMVDYKEHSCNSLSSIYMFNLTLNGGNLFEKKNS